MAEVNNFVSVSDVVAWDMKLSEIILKLSQCLIAHLTTDSAYMESKK